MIPAELLRRIRNDLPMAVAIAHLGRDGPPSKLRDGHFVFLCPRCREMLAYVNPTQQPRPLLRLPTQSQQHRPAASLGYDFLAAVALLERWLDQYQARRPRKQNRDVRVDSPPRRNRRAGASPEFAGIRETSHHDHRISTARIWLQVRPQFGAPQLFLPRLDPLIRSKTFGGRGPIVNGERWFYRSEDEWAAIVERLKRTARPHRRAVGTLIRHGVLTGFDDSGPGEPSAPGASSVATAIADAAADAPSASGSPRKSAG